jgi:hypothetical protein
MITHPEGLEQLSERIDELEKRVMRLENSSQAAPVEEPAKPAFSTARTSDSVETLQLSASLTFIGKALLGIAGAYLLRAVSASGALPRAIVAPIAVAYAIGWLVVAIRSGARGRLAGVLYSSTSILILAPMLWELCLRFDAMSASVAALVIALYVAVTVILARGAHDPWGLAVAYTGAALTALALSIGTHDMAPFTAVLLAMAILTEFARIRGRAVPFAHLVFLAVDLDIWALILIYRSPAESRPEYPSLGPGLLVAAPLLLFAVHVAGIALHTLGRRRPIAVADVLQAMIALFLVACGLLWFTPAEMGTAALGTLCAALAGACYWLVLGPVRASGIPRNSIILAGWGLALLPGGTFLLSPHTAPTMIAILGSAAMVAHGRLRRRILESHSAALLAVAGLASGTLLFAWHCLVGQMPPPPGWFIPGTSVLTIFTSAICLEVADEDLPDQVVHFTVAFLAAAALSGLLVYAAVGLAASVLAPSAFHVALLRTTVLCTMACMLAFAGARLRRMAWTRMAYVLVVFATAKLLFEDLRHGRLEFAAGSICLVALTFILVPRIASRGRRSAGASSVRLV